VAADIVHFDNFTAHSHKQYW